MPSSLGKQSSRRTSKHSATHLRIFAERPNLRSVEDRVHFEACEARAKALPPPVLTIDQQRLHGLYPYDE